MISEFCIRRPVATLLMSFALILGGIFAYKFLPVAALPSAEFPVVNVSASLPGASPETMATSVATPLIKQFATIAGIDSISTTNSLGQTSIAIQFVLNRDIDAAAADVQAAIARTQKSLPPEMTSPPSYRKVNPADAPILLMSLVSDTVPLTDLDAFAENVISPSLSTIDGVAQVSIFGQQKYAVRIQIDPTALAARGISIDQLQAAVASANSNTPLGVLQNNKQQLTITANTQLTDAAGFSNLIIATKNGHPVRLGEVTRVVDSVQTTTTASWYDGTRAIIMAVQRQPDANTVDVVDKVKAMLPSFQDQMPAAAQIKLLNDRSTSIRQAVDDVQFTLLLTIALVVMVIFVFLRRVTATIIPAVAVPISLIATLGAMFLFGFSIDNISLMGLTLAVGLVVDDAIVMLENIFRHMEEDGLSAFDASLKGAREIGFTIISISISLVAVFIPVLLMGGVIGRIFNEFAVVVTVAILASMFVSLTLTPMLCSRLLSVTKADREAHGAGRHDIVTRAYDWLLSFCLRHTFLIFLVFITTAAASVWVIQVSPKGFFPQEDIGQISVTTIARQDISFDAMAKLQGQVASVFSKSPYVDHVAWSAGSGNNALNQGQLFVQLKGKDQRPNIEKVLADLRRQLAGVAGIETYMQPVQNLRLGSRSSASAYQLVVQGLDTKQTDVWAQKLNDAMAADHTMFTDVTSDLQNNALQASLVIDRDKAAQLGIDTSTLRSALYGGFGTDQVSTIFGSADSYQVITELDPKIEWSPEHMLAIQVRTASGSLVPLGAFARVDRTAGALTVNQLGQLPAVTISYNLPQGVSLGDSVTRIDQLKEQIGMPTAISTSFAGTAKTFQDSLANQGLLIGGAILTIYIVLGMLYESFIHPLTILTGLPSAVLGAVVALRFAGMDLSVIAVIGILMLIGIVKKNGIMMVDVALELRRQGMSAKESIHKACLMRFRPIMMTTLAALMGTFPIALGTGASAELRQPLGVAVVGGLLASQALTLFVTPVIYVYFENFSGWLLSFSSKKSQPALHVVEGGEQGALFDGEAEPKKVAAE
ncbi:MULTISPECIES: efflux RND transporter permease subunit [unclassified Mesorhizobium]|uniref:efflux RND transporter permease subunit n=1 Tax=unclassified Mesorhizobium TaxID=325217 RepID=UPI000FD6E33E|nr:MULTISPECIES: efflux RND transporter permease subunit [unclassified Mesorhizobium]TGQ17078.1 efflux RND transporter permease subunit [Mesorhizobium sp. M2E.F.Ca.ET.219.01.1.1]TGT76827.1 efflux RND transporter permease subunit [Mesorhizobium sp. M2E.F.Ca.ET.166.01.1.1]TGW02938.1 efflux RND transporter permease subunit [Mesorhizobium sp. M2E.F.Ca.ET.154.01.1.1]